MTTRPARRVGFRLRDERGQGLIEYALIISLVGLASIVALGFLSGKINTLFNKSGNVLNSISIAGGGGGAGGGGAPCAPPCGWAGGSGPPANGAHVNGTFDNFWLDGSTIQHWNGSSSSAAQAGIYDNNGSSGNNEGQGSQHSNLEVRTYSMNGSSFTCRWHASSGIYAGWWYVGSPTPHPPSPLPPNSGILPGQMTFEWGCWPDGDMTPPTADTLAINNGSGTNNRMDTGDTIVIGFSEAIAPGSICPEGWDGSNRPGSVTIVDSGGSGSNDGLDFNIFNTCSENFGDIDLGHSGYTSGDESFDATYTLVGATMTVTIGARTSGGGDSTLTNNNTPTAVYDPDGDITDLAGNDIASGDTASSTASHF